jgi:hypothetical protein
VLVRNVEIQTQPQVCILARSPHGMCAHSGVRCKADEYLAVLLTSYGRGAYL